MFVCCMYIETRGPTLEEIAKIIDGDEAKVVPVDIVHLRNRVGTPGSEYHNYSSRPGPKDPNRFSMSGLEKDHIVRYEDLSLRGSRHLS